MIDVQPYIDKLEILKEYMTAKIHVDVLRQEIIDTTSPTSVSHLQAKKPFLTFDEYYRHRTENIWI